MFSSVNKTRTRLNSIKHCMAECTKNMCVHGIMRTNRVNHSGETTGMSWGASSQYRSVKHVFLNQSTYARIKKKSSSMLNVSIRHSG